MDLQGANGTFIGATYNSNSITGWQYTQNFDGWKEGGAWANAFSGSQYVDVLGNMSAGNGATVPKNDLFQIINTIPGREYTLSFKWGEDVGHDMGEPLVLDIQVLDNADIEIIGDTLTVQATGPFAGVRGPNTWFDYEISFRATSNTTKILFSATPPGNGDFSATSGQCDENHDGKADIVPVGKDTDDDGLDDAFDTDNEGKIASLPDLDADGTPDYRDVDDDGDGDPTNDDRDRDGIPDYLDAPEEGGDGLFFRAVNPHVHPQIQPQIQSLHYGFFSLGSFSECVEKTEKLTRKFSYHDRPSILP